MSVSCSICHEVINFSCEEISVLNCGHLFHHSCLQEWLNTNSTCPECRKRVAANNFVQKLYPSINEETDLVYRGTSDETKSILKIFEDSTKNLQKMFTERIVNLEEDNSKLQENINIASNSVRSWQEEKLKKDEIINKLIIDNEKLQVQKEIFKKNKLAFEGLQSENKNLKIKLSSILNNLLSDDCLDDYHSSNSS